MMRQFLPALLFISLYYGTLWNLMFGYNFVPPILLLFFLLFFTFIPEYFFHIVPLMFSSVSAFPNTPALISLYNYTRSIQTPLDLTKLDTLSSWSYCACVDSLRKCVNIFSFKYIRFPLDIIHRCHHVHTKFVKRQQIYPKVTD